MKLLNRISGRNNSRKEFHAFPRSWYIIGTTQMGKSPAIPPPIWKKPMPLPALLSLYQSASHTMYSIPLFMVLAFISPLYTYEAKMFPMVLSSQPANNDRQIFFCRRNHPAVFWINLVICLSLHRCNNSLYMYSCGK